MDIQRLRNLTTGKLHTEMQHIYEDLGKLSGEDNLMTHMLPRMLDVINPWLKDQIKDSRFWNDAYDKTHLGDVYLRETTNEEKKEFVELFIKMPHPFKNKHTIKT